jgi:hypothetical protein
MALTILERGLSICGLRHNHVCEQVDDFFNSVYRSFEIWFIFYKMNCQSNAKLSEKDHDLPGIRTRDLWSSSQHTQPLHHLGRLHLTEYLFRWNRKIFEKICTDILYRTLKKHFSSTIFLVHVGKVFDKESRFFGFLFQISNFPVDKNKKALSGWQIFKLDYNT